MGSYRDGRRRKTTCCGCVFGFATRVTEKTCVCADRLRGARGSLAKTDAGAAAAADREGEAALYCCARITKSLKLAGEELARRLRPHRPLSFQRLCEPGEEIVPSKEPTVVPATVSNQRSTV